MKTPPVEEPIVSYDLARYLLLPALWIFTFILTFSQIHNGDIWWSLTEGREIVATGQMLKTNLTSYTYPDHPWISTQWLFSVTAYTVYNLFGVNGIIVLKILIVLSVVYLLYRLLRPMLQNEPARILLLALLVLSILLRVMLRAHLFSLLFFVIFLVLTDRILHKDTKALIGLPLVTILWVNFHSSVVFGLGLLFLTALEYGLIHFLVKSGTVKTLIGEKSFTNLMAALGLSLAATIFNPRGIYYLVHTVTYLNINATIGILECQPPWGLGWSVAPYYLLTALSLYFGLRRLLCRKKLEKYDLVFLIFMLLTFKYNRIIPYFSNVAVLHLANSVAVVYPNLKRSAASDLRAAGLNIGLGILLVLLPLFLIGKVPFLPDARLFGFGVSNSSLPVKATNFLKANPVDGNGYNKYFWGGYLGWKLYPQKQIFVDGRIPAYAPEFMNKVDKMISDPQIFIEMDQRYSFQYLVIDNKTLRFDLFDAYGDTVWQPVYWDRNDILILVKNDPANAEYLDKFAYQYYRPGFDFVDYSIIESSPEKLAVLKEEVKQHLLWTGEKADRFLLDDIEKKLADSRQ